MGKQIIKKIYIDTNLFIYYFENNPNFIDKVEKLFEGTTKQSTKLICSELLYLELLVLPNKENNKKIINLYKDIEKHIPNLSLAPITKEILIKASEIRAEYSYRFHNLMHLATAILNNCDEFYTSDKNLKCFKGLKVEIV